MFQLAKLFRETQPCRPNAEMSLKYIRSVDFIWPALVAVPCNCSVRSTIQFTYAMFFCSASISPPSTRRTEHFISLSGILSLNRFISLHCELCLHVVAALDDLFWNELRRVGLSHWLLSPELYIQMIHNRCRRTTTLWSCQRRCFANTSTYVGPAKTIEARCEAEATTTKKSKVRGKSNALFRLN